MVKRRIKRNFDEQLATISSLTTHTLQDLANDETKPNKKRTWHRNRVWRKGDPHTQVGGDPKVKDLLERPSKFKVDTKSDKKRTWHRNRVWCKGEPQTQVGGDDLPDRPTKVKVDDQALNNEKLAKGPHRKSGPRRWRYNRIWRRDFVWKKKHSKESACKFTNSMDAAPSAKVVVPNSKVNTATLPSADSAQVIASIRNTTHTSVSTEKPTTCRSIASLTRATVSKTDTSSIFVPSETAASNTVTESTNKTITNVSSDDQITTFNCNLTCSDKMAPTTATPCASPPKKEKETSSVNTRQSFPSTEEKMHRKSPKRKRQESPNVSNKRVLLEQSADDTPPSCRWLWSIETLMEQLCLAFEGFFL